MARNSLVRYMAVGRLAKVGGEFVEGKHQIIAFMLCDNTDPAAKNYKDHARQIMNKGSHKLKPGKRLRLTSDDDDYDLHVMSDLLDDNDQKVIVFFVVTDPDFSQAHSIGRVFEDFRSRFLSTNHPKDITKAKSGGSVNKASQGLMMDLATKYGSRKLADVQDQVEEVTIVMKDNLRQALTNVDNLQEMEAKSDRFEAKSKQFEKSAVNLKKMMKCRLYKMNAIMALLVIAIVAYIVLQFVPLDGGKK